MLVANPLSLKQEPVGMMLKMSSEKNGKNLFC